MTRLRGHLSAKTVKVHRAAPRVCFISAAVHAEALKAIARVDKLLALCDGFQRTLHGSEVCLRVSLMP
jgi:hypothetical protein